MATANELRKIMIEMFEEKSEPTLFLASHARVKKTLAEEIEIDIVRGTEQYAVDIVPGAGSRSNKKSRYTTKTYVPPAYDESYPLNSEDLRTRLPGMTAYQAGEMSYQAGLLALGTGKQVEMKNKIVRSIELQARDAMFSGTITLHDGDVINFHKKTTHSIAPTYKWNLTTGVPLTDIAAACDLCRKDGKIGASRFKLVVADNVVEALIANAQFTAKANLRHVENVQMGMPSAINAEGAVSHGVFSAGAYTIELWSYPQFYTVPTGFGLANGGTDQPYIPAGSALLMPATGLRLDLCFGGVPKMIDVEDPGLAGLGITAVPATVEGDFVPYAYTDMRNRCIEFGVASRPLFVPHQIDGLCTFNTLV